VLDPSGKVSIYTVVRAKSFETDISRAQHCTVSSHKTYIIAIGQELNNASLPIKRAKPGERLAPIKTQARSATILPNFVGLKFQIHDGKNYQDITITEDMVGHKLGEFAPYVLALHTQKHHVKCAHRRSAG
jgi:ribosomal protein S19